MISSHWQSFGWETCVVHTVDWKKILHQLIWRVSHDVYARFYMVYYIPGGAGFFPSTVTVVDEHRK